MDNYELKENEVVLYKGEITLLDSDEITQLVLTNINIVFITKYKNSVEGEINVETYPVDKIKMYQGVPQIKTKADVVEIYFTSTEKEFTFVSKTELHKFMSSAIKLITGKTKVERGAEKLKHAIEVIDDTLGVDIVGATGKVIKSGKTGLVTEVIGVFKKIKKK